MVQVQVLEQGTAEDHGPDKVQAVVLVVAPAHVLDMDDRLVPELDKVVVLALGQVLLLDMVEVHVLQLDTVEALVLLLQRDMAVVLVQV